MELRTYARIIWRYIWLIALIVGVVALYSGYQYYKLRKTPGALTAYSSSISLQIGLAASPNGDPNPADNVTAAETLADTLAIGPILGSKEFCGDVSHQVGLDMNAIQQLYPHPDLGNWQDPNALAGALSATHVHSLVTINVNWSTDAGAWAIAHAVGEVASSRVGQYLDYVVAATYTHTSNTGTAVQPVVSARVISAPSSPTAVPGTSISKLTLLALLVIVALAIAIALAFLLDYLDERVRGKKDLQGICTLPIYGEIPPPPTPGHTVKTRSSSAV